MSTRDQVRDYHKKHNDLATIGEVAEMVKRGTNHAFNRFEAERLQALEARIAYLEQPFYVRLWLSLCRAVGR